MKATDYLNSKNGPTIVAVYGSLLTILVFDFCLVYMCVHGDGWKDVPTGAAGVLLLIIGLVSGAAVADRKLNGVTAGQPLPAAPVTPDARASAQLPQ